MIEIFIGGPPARGRYIAIEGDEGAGKTTQVDMLVEWLQGRGIPAQAVREPGGDGFGEALRSVIKDPELEHEADEELLVFTAARLGMRRRVVLPLLEKGVWVVTDRSEISTFVYQGYAGGLPMESIIASQREIARVCSPDLYVVLDISLIESEQRVTDRNEAMDAFESRGSDYRQRVNMGYRRVVYDGKKLGYSIVGRSASGTVEEVHAGIVQTVRSMLF